MNRNQKERMTNDRQNMKMYKKVFEIRDQKIGVNNSIRVE